MNRHWERRRLAGSFIVSRRSQSTSRQDAGAARRGPTGAAILLSGAAGDGGASPAYRARNEMATGHFVQNPYYGSLSKQLGIQLFIGIPAQIFKPYWGLPECI
jgi:hypothetical protein